MILGEHDPREGMTPAAVAVIVAALVLLVVAGVGLVRCTQPVPPVAIASPPPESRAEAIASTAATASQAVNVTIRRPATGPHAPQTQSKNLHSGAESQSPSDWSHALGEEIVIEVSQSIAVGTSAGASASVDQIGDVTQMVPEHGPLGVVALTAPGILAADFQLARVDVPPWLFGMPLELGLDAAVNLEVGAVGVTAGGKAFAGSYGWSRWNLSEQGVALGAGLRF